MNTNRNIRRLHVRARDCEIDCKGNSKFSVMQHFAKIFTFCRNILHHILHQKASRGSKAVLEFDKNFLKLLKNFGAESFRGLGSLGTLRSLTSLGSLGTLRPLGSLGSIGSIGPLGSLGSLVLSLFAFAFPPVFSWRDERKINLLLVVKSIKFRNFANHIHLPDWWAFQAGRKTVSYPGHIGFCRK